MFSRFVLRETRREKSAAIRGRLADFSPLAVTRTLLAHPPILLKLAAHRCVGWDV